MATEQNRLMDEYQRILAVEVELEEAYKSFNTRYRLAKKSKGDWGGKKLRKYAAKKENILEARKFLEVQLGILSPPITETEDYSIYDKLLARLDAAMADAPYPGSRYSGDESHHIIPNAHLFLTARYR